jgi:hypothetical protein
LEESIGLSLASRVERIAAVAAERRHVDGILNQSQLALVCRHGCAILGN